MEISKNTDKKSRLLLCLCVSAFVSFSLFVFGPIELFITNQSEFWFELSDIIFYVIATAVSVFAMIFLLGFFLKGKVGMISIRIFWGLGLASYIQGNFLNLDYGELNGQKIDWTEHSVYAIVDIIIWIICLAAPFVINIFLRKYHDKILSYLSLAIIIMQTVAIISVLLTSQDINKKDHILSNDNMLSVSGKNDIVVFVVDAMDAQWFESTIQLNSEITEKLEDFTYFNDMTCGGAPTVFGIPNMLTGEYYPYVHSDENYSIYKNYAYENTPIFQELVNNNYDIYIYDENQYYSDEIFSLFANHIYGKQQATSNLGLTSKMLEFVGYKYAPHIMKQLFWFYSGEFDSYKDTAASNQYVIDDVELYKKISNEEMTVSSDKSVFKLIHLFGSHYPLSMNKYCERVDESETNAYQQTEGSLNIVFKYIDMLKENNIYDSTNIIITADHGSISYFQNPAFMVKTAGSSCDFNTSSAQVSFKEIPATIASFFLNDYSAFGRNVFDISENEQRLRLLYDYQLIPKQFTGKEYATSVVEYQIKGVSRNLENIVEIGSVYNSPKTPAEYTLGEEISFQENGNSSDYIFFGFKEQWEEFTFSLGYIGKMMLRMNEWKEHENYNLCIKYSNIFNGPSRMTISTVKRKIFDEMLYDSGEITIPITKDDFVNGLLNLNFEWPDAASTAEVLGTEYDVLLSVAFQSMRIVVANESQSIDAEKYNYILGDVINFTQGGNSTKYTVSGFNEPWEEYTYSLGYNGSMKLYINDFEKYENYNLNITYSGIFNESSQMIISTSKSQIFNQTLENFGEINISLKQEDFVDGLLTLNFEWPDAVSTADVLGTEYDILLSVAFSSMTLTQE